MDKKNIIKKIIEKDYIYLIIFIIFSILIAILFFFSSNFIRKNVNKILQDENVEINSTLNIENYSLLEKKLNLPKN